MVGVGEIMFTQMSNKEYHHGSLRAVVGSSMLKVALEDMNRYRAAYLDPRGPSKPPTPALMLGDMVHLICLEGLDECMKKYAIKPPELNKKGAKNQAKYAAWERSIGGARITTQKLFDHAYRMSLALCNHEGFVSLQARSKCEETFTWTGDGVHQKIRPDMYDPKSGEWGDIKTCVDPLNFENLSFRLGYHISAAHYEAGLLEESHRTSCLGNHTFYVIDSNEPHTVYEKRFSNAAMEAGYEARAKALNRIRKAQDSGDWSEPRSKMTPIEVPSWYREYSKEVDTCAPF